MAKTRQKKGKTKKTSGIPKTPIPGEMTPDEPKTFLEKEMKKREKTWIRSGPPKKKTKKRLKGILGMISVGYPINVACSRNGVSYEAFRCWVKEDKLLSARLNQSLDSREDLWINPILEGASRGDKDDCEWLLQHTMSHKYSKRLEIDPDANDRLSDPTSELIAFILGEEEGDDSKKPKGKG